MERTEEKRRSRRNSVNRFVLAALGIILQLVWVMWLTLKLTEYYAFISLAVRVLSLVFVFRVYIRDSNSAYKILWIFLLLCMPVFGLCLFVIFGRKGKSSTVVKRFSKVEGLLSEYLGFSPEHVEKLRLLDPGLANEAYYIEHSAGYPLCENSSVRFFGDTNDALTQLKLALSGAEKFIFMEYHAIEDSVSWHGIEKILAEKAAQGVDVRIIYDDMGSLFFIDKSFIKHLSELGIACVDFNPFLPIANVFMNNRDHRKLTIVDGRKAFTGGYNLADEYFNLKHPYGVWKDSGIMLEGDAVRSMTIIFLEMWYAIHKKPEDPRPFLPESVPLPGAEGFVAPYADNPLDNESAGENVYLNLIKNAKRYVYIATPYLICSDEMLRELTLASRRGVDVRIVTPGIPDKRIIFKLTRSYYTQLLSRGVRIFEFTPGFMHAKQFVADDEVAVNGTINLDFRSLYLHFENACWFCRNQAVLDVKEDFLKLFEQSTEVPRDYGSRRSIFLRILECILRLFSPLL